MKLVFRFKIFLMLLRVPVIALNILFFVLILHLSQECGNLSCYVILKQAFKLNIVIVKLQFPLYIGLLHHGYKLSADAKLGNSSNLLKLFIFFLSIFYEMFNRSNCKVFQQKLNFFQKLVFYVLFDLITLQDFTKKLMVIQQAGL